jgi:hypothetical protein
MSGGDMTLWQVAWRAYIGYKKNKMSTDRESGRENIRARVTKGSRNPKHGKRKALKLCTNLAD